MSRGIPKVRRWLVNYWIGNRVVWSCKVHAPTRQFALWAARDARWASPDFKSAGTIDKITATVLRSFN